MKPLILTMAILLLGSAAAILISLHLRYEHHHENSVPQGQADPAPVLLASSAQRPSAEGLQIPGSTISTPPSTPDPMGEVNRALAAVTPSEPPAMTRMALLQALRQSGSTDESWTRSARSLLSD